MPSIPITLPFPDFHPEVNSVSRSLYESGHFTQALKEASIRLEECCKSELLGMKWVEMTWVPLMQKLFSSKNCLIPFVNLSLQSNIAKQDAYRDLFAWFMWAVRNSVQHSTEILDDIEALYWLNMVSYLFYKLDRAKEMNTVQETIEQEPLQIVQTDDSIESSITTLLLTDWRITEISSQTQDQSIAKLTLQKVSEDIITEQLEVYWKIDEYNYYFAHQELFILSLLSLLYDHN